MSARVFTLQVVAPATTRGHGERMRCVPELRGVVEVTIDWATIERTLAVRALRSKGGRCVAGPVLVKRVRK